MSITEEKQDRPRITFTDGKEEVMILEKGFFFYRGEKIRDTNQAYERFCEWLKRAGR